jgi:hypothetical protein
MTSHLEPREVIQLFLDTEYYDLRAIKTELSFEFPELGRYFSHTLPDNTGNENLISAKTHIASLMNETGIIEDTPFLFRDTEKIVRCFSTIEEFIENEEPITRLYDRALNIEDEYLSRLPDLVHQASFLTSYTIERTVMDTQARDLIIKRLCPDKEEGMDFLQTLRGFENANVRIAYEIKDTIMKNVQAILISLSQTNNPIKLEDMNNHLTNNLKPRSDYLAHMPLELEGFTQYIDMAMQSDSEHIERIYEQGPSRN